MSSIHINRIVKAYAAESVVDDVTIEIADGEFFVLVGPSGCGKSTLLRMLAGLEAPTSGSIHFDDAEVTNVAPRDRDIAMVFQNYALYPHMSVEANIGYGLRVRGMRTAERKARVRDVAELLGLQDVLARRPSQLSGGQRQRVAMGRAIARQPRLYLMDEPLSNLDAKLRVVMRAELASLHERLGVTMVYVTHDQVEAMTLGQRAAVLRDGVLQQVDTPQLLYREPANVFVGAFIGSPPMNFVAATLDGATLTMAGWRLGIPERLRPAIADGPVLVGVRPEAFVPAQAAPEGSVTFEASIAVREDLGHETLVFFEVDAPRVDIDDIASAIADGDDASGMHPFSDRSVFGARLGSASSVAPGATLPLALSAESLHFFDPVSGRNVTTYPRSGGAHVSAVDRSADRVMTPSDTSA